MTQRATVGSIESRRFGLRIERWPDWQSLQPSEKWEDVGEFTISSEWNGDITRSLGDQRSWSGGDESAVGTGILTQKVMQMLIDYFWVPPPDGTTSLHARQYTHFFSSARVSEKMSLRGRVPEKFVKRGKQYIILEGYAFGEDGIPRLYYRQTRMVAGL